MDNESKKGKNGRGRTRTWSSIIYPESCVKDWKSVIIDKFHVPFVCSPLHDKDVDEDGNVKKSHYHIILFFDSVKDYHQVKEITDEIGALFPQRTASVRGSVRYTCHADSPSKYQYNPDEIEVYGGIDIRSYFEPADNKYVMIGEMMDFVDSQGITEFCSLMRFSRLNKPDWFRLLCDNCTYVMSKYIASKRYGDATCSNSNSIVTNSDGEVISITER